MNIEHWTWSRVQSELSVYEIHMFVICSNEPKEPNEIKTDFLLCFVFWILKSSHLKIVRVLYTSHVFDAPTHFLPFHQHQQ